MPEFKRYEIKGKKVLFREMRHCIHSNKVKEKQGNRHTEHEILTALHLFIFV